MPKESTAQEVRTEKQLSLARGRQLLILRRAALPCVVINEGGQNRSVKPRDMVILLRVIDDRGQGCWPCINTIAVECRLSRNSVLRAMKGLKALCLLAVDRSDGVNNKYTIDWTELERFYHPDQSPVGTPPVPTGNHTSPHLGTLNAQEAPIKRPSVPAGWEAIEREFKPRLKAVRHFIAKAKEDGEQPEELGNRIRRAFAEAAIEENAGKLNKDVGGAVAWLLREGEWPVPNMLTIAERDSQRERREAAASYEAEERERFERGRILDAENASRYGPMVDAMSRDDRLGLVGQDSIAAKLIRRGDYPRLALLDILAAREAVT